MPARQIFAVLGDGDHAADLVFEFAHIAGKSIDLEGFDHVIGDAEHAIAEQAAMLADEKLSQRRNIRRPRAQRRPLEFEALEAEVKILAKGAVLDEAAQRPVGGRNDAHVAKHRLVGAKRLHLALLQEAQQAHLK